MTEAPNQEFYHESRKETIKFAYHLLGTVRSMGLSSAEIFGIEKKHGEVIFSALPPEVCTLILEDKIRFDREGETRGDVVWTDTELSAYLASLG